MKKIILILFVMIQTVLFAQGSTYSRLGVGDLLFSPSGRNTGMGSFTIGAVDRYSINEVNPASWSGINLTRFQMSVNYLGKNITASNSESVYSQASFGGFSIAVPLQRDWGLVTSMGFLPVSRVDYAVNAQFVDPNFGEVTKEFSGKGGLSKMYIGASYKLPMDIVFGASLEYYFGKIDYKSAIVLPDTLHFSKVTYTSRKGFSGLGATFGLLTPNINKYMKFKSIEDVRIGITFSLPATINTDTSIISTTSTGANQLNNGLTESYIPLKVGIGASVKLKNDYLISADFITQNWSDYRFAEKPENDLSNYTRLSLGVELLGMQKQYATFWEQVSYRFGLSFEQSQYVLVNGKIEQYALHTGISFPLGAANSIDIGIVAGFRGKKNDRLLLEKFFGTSVSLNFGELWFVRRKR